MLIAQRRDAGRRAYHAHLGPNKLVISKVWTDEVGEFLSAPLGRTFPLSLFVLQSDGLGEPQPKYLLGFIDTAQLKMSE